MKSGIMEQDANTVTDVAATHPPSNLRLDGLTENSGYLDSLFMTISVHRISALMRDLRKSCIDVALGLPTFSSERVLKSIHGLYSLIEQAFLTPNKVLRITATLMPLITILSLRGQWTQAANPSYDAHTNVERTMHQLS